MKRFFSFLRKYYGSLIGGAVGLLLMVVYYVLILQEPTAASSHVLGVVEFATPSIETINSAIAWVMGAATFFFWMFLLLGTFFIIFLHVFTTVFIYGFIGFLIHYGVVRLHPRPVIDKPTNI